MTDLVAKIMQLYPTAIYDLPCTEAEIAEAEELLEMRFPDDLRMIYVHFNGFWIPGYPTAIFPLLPRHHNTSTVGMTRVIREDPDMPMKEKIIFYGNSSRHYKLGIRPFPSGEVIQYSPDLEAPEFVATTVWEAFVKDERWSLENFGPPPWRKTD